MRSLFKLSLAAALALVVAGGAYAAEMKITGNIGAGFGIASYGEKDSVAFSSTLTTETIEVKTHKSYSEFTTSWESNLRFSYGDDDLMAILRFRPRGHNAGANGTGTGFTSTANDIYDEILWKPAPAMSILFGRLQGPAWSNPMAGSYLILNPLGSPDYWMNWTGVSGLDLEYNAGVVQVGLAISSQCKPSCGVGNLTGVSVSGAGSYGALTQQNTQTMAPHITGKFGDIAIRAMLPSASGDIVTDEGVKSVTTTATGATVVTTTKADTDAGKGSGYQAGLSWAGPGVAVAFDLQGFTDAALKSQKDAGIKDLTRSGMALKVDASGFQFAYHTLTWGLKAAKQADDDKTDTYMKLSYTMKVGAGAIIPEYTSRTLGLAKEGKSDASDTLIRVVGNMSF